ncbi:MAG: hypothetical protein WCK90_02370 [archaeon]
METIILEKTKELKINKKKIEEKLGVKITIQGRKVTFEGDPMNEYEASIILDALGLGFTAEKALLLTDADIQFKKVNIKSFTRRKKIKDVRARVIGREGKTKRTMETIGNCDIVINGNTVGIIGPVASIDEAVTALTNLIRGSKEANVYNFMERMNTEKKKYR